jgi:aminoglycoside phosphotransferase (APT) family kinase protein
MLVMSGSTRATPGHPVPAAMARWLVRTLADPGPFELRPLSGGNSNETLLLRSAAADRVLRRPPAATLAPRAHSMEREHRVLRALAETGVPAPRALALCSDPDVAPAPFLVMEHVRGVALTDRLPTGYPPVPGTARAIGEAAVDALARLHRVDWRACGLDGFGTPDGFIERQVARWRGQYERNRVRELPRFDQLARWLERHRPPDGQPGILHGDFHLDNCLLTETPPTHVTAIIDWEMATIGDPLLDLGLLLAFYGDDRPAQPAMPRVQAVTRIAGAPSRRELAERYARASGRSVQRLDYYMTLAFWKLAAIVEGAYAHHLAGRLDTPYARALEHDVPQLLEEAAGFAGLADADPALPATA